MGTVGVVSAMLKQGGAWACEEGVREFVEFEEILRFFRGVVVGRVRCAQMRDVFVLVGHCYEGEGVTDVMSLRVGCLVGKIWRLSKVATGMHDSRGGPLR